MEDLKVGDIIKERYELVRFLGSGSFGEVWLARDRMTDRDVALKIYLSLDPAGVDEFQREYSNTIDLSSPYLLTPEYFDVFHHRPFLVMKYCERGSSSKLAGNISEEQLWSFIEDVANGLDVLHSQSDPIVHQDIKPDNILIDNSGRFRITDFGISKRLRATMRRLSKRDVGSGAMPYMAPERFDSNPKLSTASDIWSLGASIYELATGELPFSGFGGAMQRKGAEIPKLPLNFSEDLNSVMHRCLSINEAERPTTAELIALSTYDSETSLEFEEITDFEIQNPESDIKLNIKGDITNVTIQPKFDNKFGWVWGFVILFFTALIFAIFITFEDFLEYLYSNGQAPILPMLFRLGVIACTVAMWLTGYYQVKRWNAIGKYLMCGAIYIIISFWLWGLYGMINLLLPQSNNFFNKDPWYANVEPIIPLTSTIVFILATFYGLFCAIGTIKKGEKENPAIWSYSGNKLTPIVMEYILPSIIIVVYAISWMI